MKSKKIMATIISAAVILGIGGPTATHAASVNIAEMQDFMTSGEGKDIADSYKDFNGYSHTYNFDVYPANDEIIIKYSDGSIVTLDYSKKTVISASGDAKDFVMKAAEKAKSSSKSDSASSSSDTKFDGSFSESDYNYIKKVQGASMAECYKFAESSKGKKIISDHKGNSNWDWSLSTTYDHSIAVTYDDGSKTYFDYKNGKVIKDYSSQDMQDLKERRIKNEVTKYMGKSSGKKLVEKWATDHGIDKEFTWTSDYKLTNKQVLVDVKFTNSENTLTIDYRSNKIVKEGATEKVQLGAPPELPKGTTAKATDTKTQAVPVTNKNLGEVTTSDVNKGLADASSKVVDDQQTVLNKVLTTVGLTKNVAVEGESEVAKTAQAEKELAQELSDKVKTIMDNEGKAVVTNHKSKDGKGSKYKYAIDKVKNKIVVKYDDDSFSVIDIASKQEVKPDGPIVFDPNVGTTMVNGYAVPNYIINTEDTALNDKEKYMKVHGDPTPYLIKNNLIVNTDKTTTDTAKTAATGTATVNTATGTATANTDTAKTVAGQDATATATTQTVKGKKSPNGEVSTWLKGKYYDQDGYSVIGWKEIEGKNYYFDADGLLVRGLKEIDGKYYLLATDDGSLTYGWQNVNDKYYYFDSTGVMKNGWLEKGDGNWYYLDGLNGMRTGWFKANNKWYCANDKGMLKSGWIKDDGKYYYLGTDGALKTSPFQIDGKTYNPDSNGICAKE